MTLLERLEVATEGSRELDAEIALHFKECDPEAWYDKTYDCMAWNEPRDYGSTVAYERCSWPLHNYTTSIDAALALVERKYPQVGYTIRAFKGCQSEFMAWPYSGKPILGYHTDKCLAIMIALVKAEAEQ